MLEDLKAQMARPRLPPTKVSSVPALLEALEGLLVLAAAPVYADVGPRVGLRCCCSPARLAEGEEAPPPALVLPVLLVR